MSEKYIKTDKKILDVCCGGKMFYFNKNTPQVLFCDIRNFETVLCDGRKFCVHPDIVADFTNLPFEDNAFDIVVFDPPHLISNKGQSSKGKYVTLYGCLNSKTNVPGFQKTKYGCLAKNWREILTQGFAECFRVLKAGGVLVFKWSEIEVPVSEILKLTPHGPLLGNRCGKSSKTHWIIFVK